MLQVLNQKKFIYSVVSVLFIIFLYIINRYSCNIPFSDDYAQQLDSINLLHKNKDTLIRLMFRQHNEHRLFTTYVLTYGYYFISGLVNHKVSILISVFMMGGIWLTIREFIESKNNVLLGFIVALFLFVPHCSSSVWAGGSVQYYGVVLFGLLSILKLHSSPTYTSTALSLSFLFLAVYSMIAGIILPFIGLLYLISSKRIFKVQGIVWVIGAISILTLYFINFKNSAHHPSTLYFLSHPIFSLKYTLNLLGGFWMNNLDIYVLPVFTFIISTFFIHACFKRLRFRELLKEKTTYAFLYILLVVGSIVAGRVGLEELGQAFADRYFIFTKCLWILALILLVNHKIINRSILLVILGGALLFYSSSYRSSIHCLRDHQERLHTSLGEFLWEGNSSALEYPNKKGAGNIIKRAIGSGYYQPSMACSKITDGPSEIINLSQNVSHHLDVAKKINRYLYLRGWGFVNGLSSSDSQIRIGISSRSAAKPSIYIQPTITQRQDIQNIYGNDDVDLSLSGFKCVINLESLSLENDYRIYLIVGKGMVDLTPQVMARLKVQDE